MYVMSGAHPSVYQRVGVEEPDDVLVEPPHHGASEEHQGPSSQQGDEVMFLKQVTHSDCVLCQLHKWKVIKDHALKVNI